MTKLQGCNQKMRKRFARNKLSAAVLGLSSAILANGASALGLGEINLKSALDQNLDAEIQLLEVRDLSKAEVLVGLAEQSAFDRQGVERSYFLTNIKFEVDLNARSGPVVRLSSDQPIREPFIDFIVEARWPSGKLLREYTVLLDLPVYAEDTPAPVAPVQAETVSGSQQVKTTQNTDTGSSYNNPRSSYDAGRSSQQSSVRSTSSQSTYTPSYTEDSYRVQSNDTLWEIALDVRPDSSVSVHQTMIALHRANPDAFINGNINLLKSGKILRIPEQDEVRNLNNRDAVRQVAQHNQDWNTGDTAAPLEASNSNLSSRAEESRGEGRLSLVSPEQSFDVQSGRVSGGDSASSSESEALQSELAATQETLDKTRGENQDLQSKINSLEDQISTLESMIQISNESLRAMELAAANGDLVETVVIAPEQEGVGEANDLSQTESGEGVTESVNTGPMGDGASSDTKSDSYSAEAISEEASAQEQLASEVDDAPESEDKEAAVVEEKRAADPTKVVYSAPKKESGVFDLIKEYFLFIGLGILAIGAGIFFFFKKRKDDEEFDDFLDPDFEYDESEASEEEAIEDGASEDEIAAIAEESDEMFDAPELDDIEEGEQEDSSEPETEDVVAESDIYIAYGKYDQAEEMLVKALNAKPDHHEARLKLLEIHSTQGNVDAFDPHYAALMGHGAPSSLVSRAEILRENIADAPDFDPSMYETGQFDVETDVETSIDTDDVAMEDLSEELDLDLADTDGLETELNLEAIDLDTEGSDSLDFDLDLDDDADSDLDEEPEIDTPLTDEEESTGSIELLGEESVDLDDSLTDSLDLTDSDDTTKTNEDSIEFDLDGLDFDADAESVSASADLDSELNSLDEIGVAEGVEIADDFGLSDDEVTSSFSEDSSESAIEFDLGDLEDIDISSDTAKADAIESELTESELTAPSLQDELETDLGAIDFDLSEMDDVSEEIESDESALTESVDEGEELNNLDENADDDDTLIRGEIAEQDVDELPDVADELDLESLDAELDELSADLSETNLDKDVDDFDDLDADLGASDTEEVEDFEAEVIDEDLGATLAEGEQILAELEEGASSSADIEDELDIDLPEIDEVSLESAATEFEELDLSEGIETESETEVAFDEFDLGDEPDLNDKIESDSIDVEGDEAEPEVAFEEFDLSDELDSTPVPETSFEEFDLDGELELDSNAEIDNEDEGDFETFESFDEQTPSVDAVPELESPETEEVKEDTSVASESSSLDSLEFDLPDIDPEAADDSDLDFLSSADEISTKLDLAAAYVDMGDVSGAKEILDEVLSEGNDEQKSQANSLLEKLNA